MGSQDLVVNKGIVVSQPANSTKTRRLYAQPKLTQLPPALTDNPNGKDALSDHEAHHITSSSHRIS